MAWRPDGRMSSHISRILLFLTIKGNTNFNICNAFFSQSVMNRIHTITVPYAVMKACPMSWVQRVHIHKGSASVKLLDV